MSEAIASPTVVAIRDLLFADLITVPDFTTAVEKSPRIVEEWVKRGLPVVYMGRTRYVVLSKANDWLRAQRSPHRGELAYEPRGRGRPRKDAA